MMILLLAAHILGALFWVGGMAFAYTMLRPAAATSFCKRCHGTK